MSRYITYAYAKEIRKVMLKIARIRNKNKALPVTVPCTADIADAVNIYLQMEADKEARSA